jgi:hypothetical protein
MIHEHLSQPATRVTDNHTLFGNYVSQDRACCINLIPSHNIIGYVPYGTATVLKTLINAHAGCGIVSVTEMSPNADRFLGALVEEYAGNPKRFAFYELQRNAPRHPAVVVGRRSDDFCTIEVWGRRFFRI